MKMIDRAKSGAEILLSLIAGKFDSIDIAKKIRSAGKPLIKYKTLTLPYKVTAGGYLELTWTAEQGGESEYNAIGISHVQTMHNSAIKITGWTINYNGKGRLGLTGNGANLEISDNCTIIIIYAHQCLF